MAGTSTAKIPANDRTACDDGFTAEDDILWTGDGRAARDFVSRVLFIIRIESEEGYLKNE